jgi:hypothetical protein
VGSAIRKLATWNPQGDRTPISIAKGRFTFVDLRVLKFLHRAAYGLHDVPIFAWHLSDSSRLGDRGSYACAGEVSVDAGARKRLQIF